MGSEYNADGRKMVEIHGKLTLHEIHKLLVEHGKVISGSGDEYFNPGYLARLREALRDLQIPYSEKKARIVRGTVKIEHIHRGAIVPQLRPRNRVRFHSEVSGGN